MCKKNVNAIEKQEIDQVSHLSHTYPEKHDLSHTYREKNEKSNDYAQSYLTSGTLTFLTLK